MVTNMFHCRISYTGSIGAYDPFTSAPHTRSSPPKPIVLESPGVNSHTHTRNTFSNGPGPAYYSPYATSSTTRRPDSIERRSQESFQPTKAVRHEMPVRKASQDRFDTYLGSPTSSVYTVPHNDNGGQQSEAGAALAQHQTRKRPLTQDEFDGPSQLLPLPAAQEDRIRAQLLPKLPVHLDVAEQEEVMRRYNDALSACAFHFIAKYQFPVPLERDKSAVRTASDRDWTEWAYLLKRLATKRRIPARVLHDNQIRNLVTILENSIPIRSSKPREQLGVESTMKDDRYLLQLVSAGVQVTRILMDSLAMQQLIELYVDIEAVILNRRQQNQGIGLNR